MVVPTHQEQFVNLPSSVFFTGLIYKNSMDCFLQTLKNEGFWGLYKGFIPCWLRMAPWSLTFWVSFEQIRKICGAKSWWGQHKKTRDRDQILEGIFLLPTSIFNIFILSCSLSSSHQSPSLRRSNQNQSGTCLIGKILHGATQIETSSGPFFLLPLSLNFYSSPITDSWLCIFANEFIHI